MAKRGGQPLPLSTQKLVRGLIKRRAFHDSKIAEMANARGHTVSQPYVCRQRTAMGLPALKFSVDPAAIVRGVQLVRTRELNDVQISKRLKDEKFPLSHVTVRKLRQGMNLPTSSPRGIRKSLIGKRELAIRARVDRVQKLKVRYTRKPAAARAALLKDLKAKESRIIERLGVERDWKKRNSLLARLAEVDLQLKALAPLPGKKKKQ